MKKEQERRVSNIITLDQIRCYNIHSSFDVNAGIINVLFEWSVSSFFVYIQTYSYLLFWPVSASHSPMSL